MEMLRIAGQSKSWLLNAGAVQAVRQTSFTGKKRKVKPVFLVMQKILNCEAGGVQFPVSFLTARSGRNCHPYGDKAH